MPIKYDQLNDDPLPWLLEPDSDNPGVRYYALRYLLGQSEEDPETYETRENIMMLGPIPAILDAQHPDGYWVKPGGGYWPSYRATVWQIIFLADLGADLSDERVKRGCEYLLSHCIARNGAFSMSERPIPSKAIHCLNGDLIYALSSLGYGDDSRLKTAIEWQAQAIIGREQIRYFRSGTTAPKFACVANNGQPCAWGATKAMKGLARIPLHQRTPEMQQAIEIGIDFLLSRDPSIADYPYVERINSNWFKFGYPLSYQSDVLETVAVLVDLGYRDDPRLDNAMRLILSKQDNDGRWQMEKSLNGKMWIDIEAKGKPSKWVTLRALRALGMEDIENAAM